MGQGQGELAEKLLGDQKVLAQLGAEALDAGGGVQHVAVVCHFATEVAHFSRNHLAAVGGGLKVGGNAVASQELAAGVVKCFLKVEEQVQGAGLLGAVAGFPGNEYAVACELVDFAVVFFAAVRQELVVVLDKAAVLVVTQLFANGGGGAQVDKHEHQVFFHRFLGLAHQGVPEHPLSELLEHRTDEGDDVAHDKEFRELHVEAGTLEYVDHAENAFFAYEAFAALKFKKQNAEGQVGGDCSNKVEGTEHHGGPHRALVHFVLQDHDVVDTVGNAHEYGEL